MTTAYTLRVTIVCPEALIPDANQLALVIGESAADDQTFGTPRCEDASGNLYAISSSVVTGSFEGNATTTLEAPSHAPEADLTAAGRAQSALYIYGVHGTEGATLGRLWAFVEPVPSNAQDAIDLSGVSQIEDKGLDSYTNG